VFSKQDIKTLVKMHKKWGGGASYKCRIFHICL